MEQQEEEILECFSCDNPITGEVKEVEIFHPFEEEPEKLHLCVYCFENLPSNILFCDDCGRYIWESNGMRQNMILVEEDEDETKEICVSCYQGNCFEFGQPRTDFEKGGIKGDFYNDSDLISHGFTKEKTRFVSTNYNVTEARSKCLEFIDLGNKVIICYESIGMWLEGYIAIWYKK